LLDASSRGQGGEKRGGPGECLTPWREGGLFAKRKEYHKVLHGLQREKNGRLEKRSKKKEKKEQSNPTDELGGYICQSITGKKMLG